MQPKLLLLSIYYFLLLLNAAYSEQIGLGKCSLDSMCSGHGTCEMEGYPNPSGRCICAEGWTCPTCTVATNVADVLSQLDIDFCAYMYGGALCSEDRHCGGGTRIKTPRGRCVNGLCQCNAEYTCADCSVSFSEIILGRQCPQYNSFGGASCEHQCPNGVCIDNTCACNSGFMCSDCSLKEEQVFSGLSECAAPIGGGSCLKNTDCQPTTNMILIDADSSQHGGNTGGECVGGKCRCFDEFGCYRCNELLVDLQKGKPCSPIGGGVCATTQDCNSGTCIDNRCRCFDGYTCPMCETSFRSFELGSQCLLQGISIAQEAQIGAPCNTSLDCSGDLRGICHHGECKCLEGFTCPRCQGIEAAIVSGTATCSAASPPPLLSGTGPCVSSSDCGLMEGGRCYNGSCLCFSGWTCPWCNVAVPTALTGAVKECPPATEGQAPDCPAGAAPLSGLSALLFWICLATMLHCSINK